MLDLGGPAERGTPGVHYAASALADALRAEADRLGDDDERARAKAAWRRLAAVLLGESQRNDASIRALTAWTMHTRREALDHAIDRADADAAWLSAVLLTRLAADVPGSTGLLDTAIRDAVAPLVAEADGPGWFFREPGRPVRAAPIDERRAALLDEAGRAPAYAPSVGRARRLLDEAAAVLDPPGWVSGEAATRLERAWRDAAGGLFDPGHRGESAAVLERLAAWGDLLGTLDNGSRDAASVAARRAADAAIVDSPWLIGGDQEWTDALRLLTELLEPIGIEEKSLLPPLRPVWRRARLVLLGEGRRLREEIGRVLHAERPLTDPAVLARLDALRRARASARGVAALSGLIAFDEARPGAERMRTGIDRRFNPVARRLVDLAREADEPPGAAWSTLQQALVWADANRNWPGEAALRDGSAVGAEMARIAGEPAASILEAINTAREDWLLAWADGERVDDAGLDARRAALSLLADAGLLAPVLRGGRAMRANAWPGFEMSDGALRAVTTGFEAAAARAWADPGVATDVAERFAAARLIAVVTRAVPPDAGFAGSLGELVAGEPLGRACWGVRARGSIARVCRYAEEAGAGEHGVLGFVRSESLRALGELGR